MGSDYIASTDGVFHIKVRDSNGDVIDKVRIDNLDDNEGLYVDLIEGRER